MHDIAILIPYGNETPWRTRAFRHVTTWYKENFPDARLVVGFRNGLWSKASAVADALAFSDEFVVVIADADCLAPGLMDAVQAVRNGSAWAMPHLKVYRLNQEATEKVYTGTPPGSLTAQRIWYDQDPYKGYEGGGVTVLRRDVYLDCPLDAGFTGWGQEDEAWALALNGLHGPPWRSQAPLYHLWHEKPERMSRYAGSRSSVARLALYEKARTKEDWMDVLQDSRALACDVRPSL